MLNVKNFKNKDIENYKIICFWKQYQKNGYLSNWYKSEFIVDNIKYNCMEQFLMAEKARLFNDKFIRNKILKTKKPNQQKALGRKVRNFNEEVWNNNKINIILKGLEAKFNQNIDLKNKLINTKDAILIEASPFDKIWGVGVDCKTAKKSFETWNGENLLGFALMYIRDFKL